MTNVISGETNYMCVFSVILVDTNSMKSELKVEEK